MGLSRLGLGDCKFHQKPVFKTSCMEFETHARLTNTKDLMKDATGGNVVSQCSYLKK